MADYKIRKIKCSREQEKRKSVERFVLVPAREQAGK